MVEALAEADSLATPEALREPETLALILLAPTALKEELVEALAEAEPLTEMLSELEFAADVDALVAEAEADSWSVSDCCSLFASDNDRLAEAEVMLADSTERLF
ncbi:hypothetical protein M3M35_06850 [Fructilactobacillus myrtifloralis]|uniref:Uncharacterized protein n=1 Tax=Fructilactobacillus myrtifloralis TaxID=2940301 RepID=A0ABY5BP29_9LACO|nr:hypothetical protein [Fructilactobacillus myrtifloralis]USS85000.1 hypothetical protein M3M35_06850 [Fructilactobacillus myrtifloralis]